MDKPVIAAYTVGINLDGSIFTDVAEVSDTVQRRATPFDIYQTSKELVSDIEAQLLADRIAQKVSAALEPKSPTDFRQKLLEALSDRGIDTPKQ